MLFRGMMKNVCCVFVLCAGVSKGMLENASEMKIKNANQLYSLDKYKWSEANSVSFYGIDIDDAFLNKWYEIQKSEIRRVVFDSCSFIEGATLASFLSGLSIHELLITKCNIDIQAIEETLRQLDPYALRVLSLANNKLGFCESAFEQMLLNFLCDYLFLDTIDIRDNAFSSGFLERISTLNSSKHFCSSLVK